MKAKTGLVTSREAEAAEDLRRAVENSIESHGWEAETVASRLEMLPGGFELLKRRRWTLEEAWRVAEALGLAVELQVKVIE